MGGAGAGGVAGGGAAAGARVRHELRLRAARTPVRRGEGCRLGVLLTAVTRYVSGAEEKVLRAFSAPSTFLANLGLITGEVRQC